MEFDKNGHKKWAKDFVKKQDRKFVASIIATVCVVFSLAAGVFAIWAIIKLLQLIGAI